MPDITKRMAVAIEQAASMPPLDSPENAKKRLEIINNMTVRGLLPGSQAGAAVRAVEVFLKAYALELDRRRMVELERRLKELQAELAKERGRHV